MAVNNIMDILSNQKSEQLGVYHATLMVQIETFIPPLGFNHSIIVIFALEGKLLVFEFSKHQNLATFHNKTRMQ